MRVAWFAGGPPLRTVLGSGSATMLCAVGVQLAAGLSRRSGCVQTACSLVLPPRQLRAILHALLAPPTRKPSPPRTPPQHPIQVVEAKEAGAAGVIGTIASVTSRGTPLMSSFASAVGCGAGRRGGRRLGCGCLRQLGTAESCPGRAAHPQPFLPLFSEQDLCPLAASTVLQMRLQPSRFPSFFCNFLQPGLPGGGGEHAGAAGHGALPGGASGQGAHILLMPSWLPWYDQYSNPISFRACMTPA